MRRIDTPEMQAFETEHMEEVRRMAPECMVLLRNDGTLPLSEVGKVALYGNGARRTLKGGTGSGDVNVRHFVTVEEGLRNAGFEVTTGAWMDEYDRLVQESKAAFFQEIRRKADEIGANSLVMAMGQIAPEPQYELPLDGEGDTAIYVLARISGEGGDRHDVPGDIQLTQEEIRDILALNRTYRHFVLVLNTGGMLDLTPVDEVSCILLMGQPGISAGDALADVLTGKAYPSGKLTMSWMPIDAYPSTEGFGDPNDTVYREGIYVGYRYFDAARLKPEYPFGYGLGYTDFELSPGRITLDDGKVTVSAVVTNTGESAGREVVQVYYSAPEGKIDKPCQELAGYAKTPELLPGQSGEVTVTFGVRDMASYDTARCSWILEEGDYIIRVGSSSRDTHVIGTLRLDAEAVTEKVQHICNGDGVRDLALKRLPLTYEGEEQERAAAPVLGISAADIETLCPVYSAAPAEIPAGEVCTWDAVKAGSKSVEEFVAGLNEDQLAWLCIGEYKDTDDILEVVGNASKTVAGAAGETTSRLADLGVPVMVMADGPAGLRLGREYRVVDGVVKGSSSIEGDLLLVYTPEELQALAEAARPDEASAALPVYYQYCTAIPIGTGIAQSWNDDLARRCGDLVGEEMEIFGIQIWLAPALNIQRSPLCGRDFEYYSEDPYLSGSMAARITEGVQRHPGCAVTIKHFACNNQETNRFFSNSVVSERAMREIYLKGFEICVKQARPMFLMTSYNLINGEHACNSHDLQTAVLRDEWGFDGVVMTDWLVTGGMGAGGEKWPCASTAGNIKAGNDITMPGMTPDKDDIIRALHDASHPYALTKADLQQCAVRVLEKMLVLK